MEGLSIIIPVFNKFETTRKCIDHIRAFNRGGLYEILIVDNGSTDETPDFFLKENEGKDSPGESPPVMGKEHERSGRLLYIRNQENLGVAKALNMGALRANHGTLCFMHNDVFVYREQWTAEIGDFILRTGNAGVVGLYGAKTLRKDGSFRGRTIVHAEKNGPAMKRPFEKVAVVDGLLMAVRREIFEKIGRFSTDFPVHYYDKDLSARAANAGLENYVLNIPFEHICNITRQDVPGEDRRRDEAEKIFTERWKAILPMDVTTWREKVMYAVARRRSR